MTDAPIILGGPHITLFPTDELPSDNRISYLVRGEADGVIVELVKNAVKQSKPVIIDAPLVKGEDIPRVDLSNVYGVEKLREFQIQLSRGCPFRCSFCSIKNSLGKKFRARDISQCIDELKAMKKEYPQISKVVISGDPEVFERINKGESLAAIERAAGKIRDHGFILGLCFVIGLPGDNLSRHKNSMQFAKKLRPNYVFGICVFHGGILKLGTGTIENGRIDDLCDVVFQIDTSARFSPPRREFVGFSKDQMVKAWSMANMETHAYFDRLSAIPRRLYYANEYNLWDSFIYFLLLKFPPAFVRRMVPVSLSYSFQKRFPTMHKSILKILK